MGQFLQEFPDTDPALAGFGEATGLEPRKKERNFRKVVFSRERQISKRISGNSDLPAKAWKRKVGTFVPAENSRREAGFLCHAGKERKTREKAELTRRFPDSLQRNGVETQTLNPASRPTHHSLLAYFPKIPANFGQHNLETG